MRISSLRLRIVCSIVCVMASGCRDEVGRRLAELASPDADAQIAAAGELAKFAGDDPRIAPALAGLLQSDDPGSRLAGAGALRERGPSAADAAPALAAALDDPEPDVRTAAALALLASVPADERPRATLLDQVRQGNGRVILAIGDQGGRAAWAVGSLKSLLAHEAPQLRLLAARTLGRIGPAASICRSDLVRLQRDPDPAVQAAAREALQGIAAQATRPGPLPP